MPGPWRPSIGGASSEQQLAATMTSHGIVPTFQLDEEEDYQQEEYCED